MSHEGEIRIDQAHRGYNMATDTGGYASCNPLFMKYEPRQGKFAGQNGYGYRSIEAFVNAARVVNSGAAKPEDFDETLPTLPVTLLTTAILEAGRLSLDSGSRPYKIVYEEGKTDSGHAIPKALEPVTY